MRVSIGAGVFTGASNPHHASASKPGITCSATVATPGNCGCRSGEVMPIAFNRPDWMCGENNANDAIAIGT